AHEAKAVAEALGRSVEDVELAVRSARARLLAARNNRPTPFVDQTIYTSWNAMFISAYFEAASALHGEVGPACLAFARRTLDRLLDEGWDERRGFAHRLGGERLDGTLDDQAFMAAALLDGFEATLDRRYYAAAEATMKIVLEKYADAEGGGF